MPSRRSCIPPSGISDTRSNCTQVTSYGATRRASIMPIGMDLRQAEEDLREKVSFLHSGIPDCSWPIVTHAEEQPEFAGIHGTGFFARKERALFFITARHCLSKSADGAIAAIANRLHIPYSLNVRNTSPSDYVQFESICS